MNMESMNFSTKLMAIAFVCLCVSVSGIREKRQASILNTNCYTPEDELGNCVILADCAGLLRLYESFRGSPQIVRYLRSAQHICGRQIYFGEPVVCCSLNFRTRQPVTPPAPVITFQPEPEISSFVTPPTVTTPTPRTMTTMKGTFDRVTTRQVKTECIGEDGTTGSCISLVECLPFIQRLQENPGDDSFKAFLRRSNAICRRPTPFVCCPSATTPPTPMPSAETMPTKPTARVSYSLPTPQQGCGLSNTSGRKIVGGETAKLGSWPWIALLGYQVDTGVSWRCGGTLITSRHVLTAAHCINSLLSTVRLGEHDLTTDTETNHIDVTVLRTVRHPRYDRRDGHSDIAIIYLTQDVEFNDILKPICLPTTPSLRIKNYVGFNPFVAGWGRTQEGGQPATVLQELQLPVLDTKKCEDRYRARKRLISAKQFDTSVLCVGVLSGGKDSCQGDSGGPLVTGERINGVIHQYLIGIVSYGIGCAQVDVPGVYCKVQSFIDWIEDRVAEPL